MTGREVRDAIVAWLRDPESDATDCFQFYERVWDAMPEAPDAVNPWATLNALADAIEREWAGKPAPPHPRLGLFRGEVTMRDDFDEPVFEELPRVDIVRMTDVGRGGAPLEGLHNIIMDLHRMTGALGVMLGEYKVASEESGEEE